MTKLYSEVNGSERSCNIMTLYICVSIVQEKESSIDNIVLGIH